MQGCTFGAPPGHTWPFPNDMAVDLVWPDIARDALVGITHFLERLRVPVVKKHDLPVNIYSSMSSRPRSLMEKNWELITAHFNELGLKHLRKVDGYLLFFECQQLM